MWQQPKYVKIVKHRLSRSMKVLVVKSGTQIIDGCWKFLKSRIVLNQNTLAGTRAFRAKLRSVQFDYWSRGSDLWIKCGELFTEHSTKFFK